MVAILYIGLSEMGNYLYLLSAKKIINFAVDYERSNGHSRKFLEKLNDCWLVKKDSIAFCHLFCNAP